MAGTNEKKSVFAAIDIRADALMYLICDRKRAVDFIEYLEYVISHYATGKIHIILDNFSVHKARSVQAWLANHPGVKPYCLP